ncbi:adhesion G-protein coupled receptor G6 isoform X3 [Lates calcarifer]|uniref:Adhesion G-protein coupled receptor G6 n=1 Tax=Lates calcarifer TaxID=8187 RepID=A0AAJ7PLC7_LATCA|nr:adhesion G-protein coupled receptor G6 isoform X3 [Lates calcarifer]
MESSTGGRWRLRHIVPVLLLWMTLHRHVLGCSSTNCNLVLTEAEGEITSPCYPKKYPNSQSCKWIIQAPAGFIIQLSFLDFELEEAPGCIYDQVVVNTGSTDVKFCGLTANGLTLNSTGNVMELSFTSDFSVQKKGFSVSFQHVAVALRNQKVKITSGNNQVTTVASSVSIPVLSHLTLCFEVERTQDKQKEWLLTYYDSSGNVVLSLGSDSGSMTMIVDGVSCPIGSIISTSDFTSTMKSFCVLWTSSNGRVAVYFSRNYWSKTCSASVGHSVPTGGQFRLGGQHAFEGNIYNVRLWDYVMTVQQLEALTCNTVGNIIDWDNSHWSIPSSVAQTDATLSCICYPNCIHLTTAAPTSGVTPPTSTPLTTTCDSQGLGCPAASSPATSSTDSTNTIHTTNANTHALSPITTSPSTIPTTSMPLTPSTTTTTTTSTTSSSTTVLPTTTITITTSPATSASPATNAASASSTAHAQQTTSSTAAVPSATTNNPATNPTTHVTGTTPLLLSVTTNQPATNIATTAASSQEELYYRISFVVDVGGSDLKQQDVERAVAQWLNQTFQGWTEVTVTVDNVSVQRGANPPSYRCQALLTHYYITNESMIEAAISARLNNRKGFIGSELQIQPSSMNVSLIENCPKENNLHYLWPESRPTVTRALPCFPNKDQWASRTCSLNRQNYSSHWLAPDLSNCTDIKTIEVSAENAAEVAEQLANITENNLSDEEVSKVVTKVKELVNVAKINTTLASTVVTIISNVMNSTTTTNLTTSEKALKMVDELVQKIEFDGPSINITSKNLALGILAVNATTFKKTSFRAFIPPNTSDPQIDFESGAVNPLAQVTLPASLLHTDSLSESDRLSLSRINFMFFSSTNFFQKEQGNHSLSSYVVASSVGNLSIKGLKDPVQIEITHLLGKVSKNPVCMFWDFSMNNGGGGWNKEGCNVSKTSTNNKTICLCNHLTHFGILMDISGANSQIDAKNKNILTFITYIGCGVSAIFSAATLLTYIAFEKLRRDYPSKILMNLSASLLGLNMVFLLDGWLASLDIDWLCKSVAVFLHYFLLTSFTWMGLESIHMYIALVKVFNTYIRRYILKFCIVGWGFPAVLVGIVVAVDSEFYEVQGYGKDNSSEGSSFCWIQKPVIFYTTCVGYFCVMFLLNVAMFIVVMLQICGRNGKRSNRTLREEVLRNLRSAISLTFLLGMTWGFALFSWGPVQLAFIYLFTIFNSLQGLFIFIFHCALKENVQKQWRRYFCCGRFKLSDNSDWSKTATNNTKKVSSDNLGKSLSSSSFGSSTANWTSKAKATLNPFSKRHSNTESSSNQ